MDLQCWPLLTALAALVAALAYVRRKLSEPVRLMTEWMKRVHAEGVSRMRRLREAVRENNVYRWAGELITELSSVRLELSARP